MGILSFRTGGLQGRDYPSLAVGYQQVTRAFIAERRRTRRVPALGSLPTRPFITTDFSESQPELESGIHTGVDVCLAQLTDLHQLAHRHSGGELVWCISMPCALPDLRQYLSKGLLSGSVLRSQCPEAQAG
jgi:hypothetical protein